MLASIESFFIFLLIAGASALFNWIKKRGENGSDWSDAEIPPPTRRTPLPRTTSTPPISRPEKATSWEEELRRMLEGATPTTQAPAPPPIVVQERKSPPPMPRPAAPVPQRAEPPMMSLPKSFEQKFYKAHCNHCDGHIEFPASAMEEVIPCPHCHQMTVLRPFEQTPVEVLAHQHVLTDFKTTERTYEQASQLSQRVAAHMHDVSRAPAPTTAIRPRRNLSPEIVETRALFKNARTVREAMVASFILGPPKALEESRQ